MPNPGILIGVYFLFFFFLSAGTERQLWNVRRRRKAGHGRGIVIQVVI